MHRQTATLDVSFREYVHDTIGSEPSVHYSSDHVKTHRYTAGEEALSLGDADNAAAESKVEDGCCRDLHRPLLTQETLRLLRAVILGHSKVRAP